MRKNVADVSDRNDGMDRHFLKAKIKIVQCCTTVAITIAKMVTLAKNTNIHPYWPIWGITSNSSWVCRSIQTKTAVLFVAWFLQILSLLIQKSSSVLGSGGVPDTTINQSHHSPTCREAFRCKHISSHIIGQANINNNKINCEHSITFIGRLHMTSFRAILPSMGFCKWKAARYRFQEHCWISIPFISAAMPIQSTKILSVYALFVCIVNSSFHTFTGLLPPLLCFISLFTSTVKGGLFRPRSVKDCGWFMGLVLSLLEWMHVKRVKCGLNSVINAHKVEVQACKQMFSLLCAKTPSLSSSFLISEILTGQAQWEKLFWRPGEAKVPFRWHRQWLLEHFKGLEGMKLSLSQEK